jgi:hypothetical protein
MRNLILAFCLLSLPVFADEKPKEYTLRLSETEVNIIASALVKRPYDEVADLLQKMHIQVMQQQAQVAPEKK